MEFKGVEFTERLGNLNVILGVGGLIDLQPKLFESGGKQYVFKKRENIAAPEKDFAQKYREFSDKNQNVAPIQVAEVNGEIGYVSPFIEGPTLEEWLDTKPTAQAKEDVLKALMGALAKLENADLNHLDPMVGNIIIQTDIEGNLIPVLIDPWAEVRGDKRAAEHAEAAYPGKLDLLNQNLSTNNPPTGLLSAKDFQIENEPPKEFDPTPPVVKTSSTEPDEYRWPTLNNNLDGHTVNKATVAFLVDIEGVTGWLFVTDCDHKELEYALDDAQGQTKSEIHRVAVIGYSQMQDSTLVIEAHVSDRNGHFQALGYPDRSPEGQYSLSVGDHVFKLSSGDMGVTSASTMAKTPIPIASLRFGTEPIIRFRGDDGRVVPRQRPSEVTQIVSAGTPKGLTSQ